MIGFRDFAFAFLAGVFVSSASAQSIQILSVQETVAGVEISVTTDIAPPFEVMADISLSGQADEDIWIGNNEKFTIRSGAQTLVLKPEFRGKKLPSGNYDVEVSFYPRWGAEKSPSTTKAIKEKVIGLKEFSLKGSGANAATVAAREKSQLWVMENTAIGDPFNLETFEKKLGRSKASVVTNRNGIIVAHYFEDADITLFENTLKHTLVTWRLGKHATL
jgi:hypothetical protein